MNIKNLKELSRDEEWFIFECVGKLKKENSDEFDLFLQDYQSQENRGDLRVEFKINDTEFNFFEVWKLLSDQVDKLIEQKAKNLKKEMIEKIEDMIRVKSNMFDSLCDSFKNKLINDLELEWDEDN